MSTFDRHHHVVPEQVLPLLLYGRALQSCGVICSDGLAGRLYDLLFDDERWDVRDLVVRTGRWPFDRDVLLAPETAHLVDPDLRSVTVDLRVREVIDAPGLDENKPVSRQEELRLHQHQAPMLGLPWDGLSRMVTVPTVTAEEELAESGESALAESNPHLRRCGAVRGYGVRLHSGELFGRIEDFVVDVARWRIRYLVVRQGTWPITRRILLNPAVITNVSWNQQAVVASLATVADGGVRASRGRRRRTTHVRGSAARKRGLQT